VAFSFDVRSGAATAAASVVSRGARTAGVTYQYPASAPPYQAPATSDPTAVIGRRIGAIIVDFLLYSLIMAFVSPTPLSPLAEYYDVPDGTSFDEACEGVEQLEDDSVGCLLVGDRVYFTESADVIAQIVTWLAVVGLYSWVQGMTGRTPGKALFGIKAVNEQGQPPGFGKSLARTVLWVVDAAPYCLPLVGFITGLSTKGHRRVGDMAAKTFVVGKGHTGPVLVPGLTTAAAGYYGGGYPGPPGQPGQPGPWGAPPPGSSGPGSSAPPAQAGWGGPPSGPPAGQPAGQPAAQPQGPWAAPGSAGEPGAPSGSSAASPFDRPRPGQTTDRPGQTTDRPGQTGERPGQMGERPSQTTGEQGPAGATSGAPGSSSYNPQWDADRGTYIVWEPNRGAWLAWDESAKEWKPI
jgi:uncharacterized RDD family membrane protein YckC